jgi:hypothetical protein
MDKTASLYAASHTDERKHTFRCASHFKIVIYLINWLSQMIWALLCCTTHGHSMSCAYPRCVAV